MNGCITIIHKDIHREEKQHLRLILLQHIKMDICITITDIELGHVVKDH